MIRGVSSDFRNTEAAFYDRQAVLVRNGKCEALELMIKEPR